MMKGYFLRRQRGCGNSFEGGLVLVAVIWIFVLMAIVAGSINLNSRLDTKISLSRVDGVQMEWACRGAVAKAIAVLLEDEQETDVVSDLWYENEEDFNNIEIGECVCRVEVVDEAGKLNINTANREQIMGLPGMVGSIAYAIIDWRDEDNQVSGDGAEGGYYRSLSYGYDCGDKPFGTVRELLLVKGIDEQVLYGEDRNLNGKLDFNERDGDGSWPDDNGDDVLDKGLIAYVTCYSFEENKDASGNSRVNINKADEGTLKEKLGIDDGQAKWIVENRKYESIGDLINKDSPKQKQGVQSGDEVVALDIETFKSIVDKITVVEDNLVSGKVNVNTAGREVLEAVFAGSSGAESITEEIIKQRESQLAGIGSVGSLLDINGIEVSDFKKVVDHVTVRSRVYGVVSRAKKARAGWARQLVCEAVLDRSEDDCKVLYWYQGIVN